MLSSVTPISFANPLFVPKKIPKIEQGGFEGGSIGHEGKERGGSDFEKLLLEEMNKNNNKIKTVGNTTIF